MFVVFFVLRHFVTVGLGIVVFFTTITVFDKSAVAGVIIGLLGVGLIVLWEIIAIVNIIAEGIAIFQLAT